MSKVYKTVITACDRFVPNSLRPLWNHEAGPKTIFFWAPAFKWGGRVLVQIFVNALLAALYLMSTVPVALVLTSLDEFRRPLDKVSPSTSASLAATGIIWTRYCLIIKPINYSLSLCNFCLGLANGVQCVRAFSYRTTKGEVTDGVEVKEVAESQ